MRECFGQDLTIKDADVHNVSLQSSLNQSYSICINIRLTSDIAQVFASFTLIS